MALPSVPQPFTPGLRLIDGSDLNSKLASPLLSAQDTFVPAGAAQATALAITAINTRVLATAANAGALLPPAVPGDERVIFNDDPANDMKVYPSGTETIDGGAAGASVTLSHTKRCAYYCFTKGAWISAQLGVVSA